MSELFQHLVRFNGVKIMQSVGIFWGLTTRVPSV